MPNLFVVTTERDLASLARSVLLARVSAANREAALEAIRRANTHVDLDDLREGTVLTIPDAAGVRASARDDPAGEVGDDLLARTQEGLALLVDASERAEGTRRTDQKEAFALFDSNEVQRLARSDRQLGATIEQVRRTFEADDAEAEQQGLALRRAAERWGVELDELRGLL